MSLTLEPPATERSTRCDPRVEKWACRTPLQWALCLIAGLLFVKTLVLILAEYHFYFPPDFDAVFLLGREHSFHGLYRLAFYAHILASPVALVSGALLMMSGWGEWAWFPHRRVGQLQISLILLLVCPSGLVMATQAMSGPMAGGGFSCLALGTGVSAAASWYFAARGQWMRHRRWTVRCFLLLCAPLVFRVLGGVFMVLEIETPTAYTMNAWVCWLVPLGILEFVSSGVGSTLRTKGSICWGRGTVP